MLHLLFAFPLELMFTFIMWETLNLNVRCENILSEIKPILLEILNQIVLNIDPRLYSLKHLLQDWWYDVYACRITLYV